MEFLQKHPIYVTKSNVDGSVEVSMDDNFNTNHKNRKN